MTIGRIVDVSSDQHPGGPPGVGEPINWLDVKAAGVTTAIIKATQGTTYTNPWFHTDVAGALGVGLDVMAYHYAGWGDVAAEAAYFLSIAGHLAQALDVERSTMTSWMRSFLQALERPADELLVYGSASTLHAFYAQLPALPWVAAYGQGYPGWGVLWQFSDNSTIQGIADKVDEDRWYGSEIAYETLFGTTAVPTGEIEMLAPTPDGKGFWRVSAAGAVVTYGDAQYLGGPNTSQVNGAWGGPAVLPPGRVVTDIVAHPSAQGYWIEDNFGDLYAYGAAEYMTPN